MDNLHKYAKGLLFSIFILIGNAQAIDVNSCQNLAVDGGSYQLNTSISSSGSCINITANNITLDGAGYIINYSQSSSGYAINNSGGFDNLTIENLSIVQTNSSVANAHAVYSNGGMINSTFDNNTISISSTTGIAYRFLPNDNNNFILNSTVSVFCTVLSFSSALNNTIINLTGTSSSGANTVYLYTSNDNLMYNSSITNTYSGGVTLAIEGNNNLIQDTTINATGANYGTSISIGNNRNNNSIVRPKVTVSNYQGVAFRVYNTMTNSFCGDVNQNGKNFSLMGTSASFNYSPSCSGGIWINTTQSGTNEVRLTRNYTNITQSNITINELLLDSSRTLYYSFSGLSASTRYQVYDGNYVTTNINSDVNGVLNGANLSYVSGTGKNFKMVEGNSAPNTTAWGNNRTNNQNLSLTIAKYQYANFNITADQGVGYTWLKDDVNQSVNFNNFSTSFNNAGFHTIKGWGTNSNGSTVVVNWSIDVPVTNNLSACGETISANGTYYLTQNVSSTGTCFRISTNDAILDGQGYTINYTATQNGVQGGDAEAYAIFVGTASPAARNNVTIKDIKIEQTATAYQHSYAIQFAYQVTNSSVKNSTILTRDYLALGIFDRNGGNFNNFHNNTITTYGTQAYPIEIFAGLNETITNNTLTTYGADAQGIFFYQSANNYTISNNVIDIYGASTGTEAGTSSNNNISFTNNTVTLHGSTLYKHGYLISSGNDYWTVEGGNTDAGGCTYGCSEYAITNTNNSMFKNMSFAAGKRIYLGGTLAAFNYLNVSIWMNVTMGSGGSGWNVINRTIVNITSQNITYLETLTESRTVYYNVSGLKQSTNFRVYNGSTYTTLTTDGNGVLPAFNISFDNLQKQVRIIDESLDTAEVPGLPSITSWNNSLTNNNSISLIIQMFASLTLSAGANQTIDTWSWVNATYSTGDATANSTATTTITTNVPYNISVSGTNTNGTTNAVNWTINGNYAPMMVGGAS